MFYGTSKPVDKKPSQEEYINDILKVPWWEKLLGKKSTNYIIGSYVYKKTIRGEIVNDIDIVTKCTGDEGHRLREKFPCSGTYVSPYIEYGYDDYVCLMCETDNGDVKIDLLGSKEHLDKNKERNFLNTVILTSNGLEDIKGNDKRKEFVIQNLKKGKYCPWNNMREKDKEYFKKFKIIDQDVCQDYGF